MTTTPKTEKGPSARRSRLWIVLGVVNLAVPVALATIVCLRTAVNIPLTDDYDCISYSMANYAEAHGWLTHLAMIFTTQHVQYKLMFLRSITALQYDLTGHTNYRVLQYLGDLTLFPVVILLWFLLARSGRPLTQRLWLFTVPCYLYLSLRYVETVNWAMSGLQNLAIVPFALATLFFLTSEVRFSFAWSMIFMVISIGTSGNGFFAAIIVLAHLLWTRRFRRAGIATAILAAMAALYAYHYIFYPMVPAVPLRDPLLTILQFPVLFLGSVCRRESTALPAGILLVAGFIWLTLRGWYRASPGTFLCASFCIVTALGVTVTRYRFGANGALAGRYVMYSLVFLSLEYIALLRIHVPREIGARWRIPLAGAAAVSMLICFYSLFLAYRELKLRKQELITHLILWERHPDRLVLSLDEDPIYQQPDWIPLKTRFQVAMKRNIALGLYIPPYSASDPLPIRTHSPDTIAIENERP